ncbi:MAG TPA: hypothetical protein VJ579_02325 [Candidatus Paceibacterota bacterium]|nr:hypothetical protein [Candidatus Paceibacterota bacterium]
MSNTSALSPDVLSYLESIRGAPCYLERFLSCPDFKFMREIAKDFGGIEIALPNTHYTFMLNVYGVIMFQPSGDYGYGVTVRGVDEDSATHEARVREFLSAVRKSIYPETDSAWCASVVVQACYSAITARVGNAIKRSVRE